MYMFMCLCMLCVSPWRTEEGVRSSGARVRGSFMGAEDQTGLLEEQYVL